MDLRSLSRSLYAAPIALACGALALIGGLAGCDTGGPGVPAHEIPPPPEYFGYPAWHPDGRYIAAEHADSVDTDGDGRRDRVLGGVWLVDAQSGETALLLPGFGAPAWSLDGRRLAVERGGHVFTLDVPSLDPPRVDTTSLRQLTTEGSDFFPAWSPDGERIAFDNTACGYVGSPLPSDACGVLSIAATGGEREFLARGRMPNWSPGGDALIYAGLYTEIFRVSLADVANPHRLTSINQADPYAASNQHPRYDPSGSRIAFVSQRDGPAAVWVMDADGSRQRRVSPLGAWSFDWSPDGRRLVFLYLRQEQPPGNGELWLVNADGTGPRRLTHFHTP